MYASFIPAFCYDSSGNPYGGFFRDGRGKTLADQAVLPFTTAFEMANADAAAVLARLQIRPYLSQFVAIYGAAALNDPDTALQDMGAALAACLPRTACSVSSAMASRPIIQCRCWSRTATGHPPRSTARSRSVPAGSPPPASGCPFPDSGDAASRIRRGLE